MDALALEFPDASFDAVFSLSSIEHFGGDSDRAAATLENAAALLSDSNPHVACIALTEANGSLLAAGDVRRAVALSERLVAIADPEQPRE